MGQKTLGVNSLQKQGNFVPGNVNQSVECNVKKGEVPVQAKKSNMKGRVIVIVIIVINFGTR